MNPNLLTIFARFPRIGRVKTRLIPLLDPESATQIYEAFLIDLLHRLIPSVHADIEISVAGEGDDHEAMSDFLRRDYRFTPDQEVITRQQSAGDLGDRLSASFSDSFQKGRRRVVVLGADHPSVPVDYLEEAFDRIDHVDVVIGPSDDGGFYALGMNAYVSDLFDNLPWSTPGLYGAVVARISSLGLSYAELPGWYDVDRPADLMRLYREVEAGLDLPATRRVFSDIGFAES